MESLLNSVKLVNADAIIQTTMDYSRDPVKDKANLSIGICCNDDGGLHYFESIVSAEKTVAEKYKSKPYQLYNGSKEFSKLTQELIFGKNSSYVKEKRICTIQTLGGIGAIYMCMRFLKSFEIENIYVTEIPYINHVNTANRLGFTVKYLRFFDSSTADINYDSFLEDLKKVEPKSAIILQPCCYNPCAVNIAENYFDKIADIVIEHNLLIIFDIAYQGFGHLDVEKDVQLIKTFEEKKILFIVCHSFSKMMALYGERGGALHIICKNKENRQHVASNLFSYARSCYNFPTIHTNRLIVEVLGNEKLKNQWLNDLYELGKNIKSKRISLFEKLEVEQKKYNLNIDWTPYKKQSGLFSYVPLLSKIYNDLKKNHVYIVSNGRINVSALTPTNIDFVVGRICQCLKNINV